MKGIIKKLLCYGIERLQKNSSKICTTIRRSRNRCRLKNKDFTILSSNCTGGIIYHELGLKFLSPTINLAIHSDQFVDFLENLHEYLKMKLVFIEDNSKSYPVAKLNDEITIYFIHYKSREEAEQKWEDRKQRINFNNLYIITNDRNGITHEDMLRLENISCKNSVMFSAHHYDDCPHVLFLPEFEGCEHVGGNGTNINRWNGKRVFENYFDFVSFLNSDRTPVKEFYIK